jgi:hypothetical protein
MHLHPDEGCSRVIESGNALSILTGYSTRVGRAMKYLKLMWLIMSGRLTIEYRNRPEKKAQLTPAGDPINPWP